MSALENAAAIPRHHTSWHKQERGTHEEAGCGCFNSSREQSQSSTLLLDSENPQQEGSFVATRTCFNFSTTHGFCRNLICQGHFCLRYYFSCPLLQERQAPLNLPNSYFYTTNSRTKHGANPQQWCVLTISLMFSKFRWGLISLTLPSQQNNEGKTNQTVTADTHLKKTLFLADNLEMSRN